MPSLLILNQHYPPDLLPTGVAIRNLVRGLSKRGWNITILTGTPVLPEGDTTHSFREVHEGVRIIRFHVYTRRKGIFQRLLHYSSYSLPLLPASLLSSCDITLAFTTPPLLPLAIATLRSYLRRKPFVYGVQDVYPDLLKGTPIGKGPLYRGAVSLFRFLEKRADRIITLTPEMAETLREHSHPPDKISVIPNPVDLSSLSPLPEKDNPLLQTLRPDPRRLRLLYSGNLGFAHDGDLLLASMKALRDLPVDFYIFSYGEGRRYLEKACQKEGIRNAFFFDLLPERRAREAISVGDLSLALLRPGMLRYLVPAKVYGSLACGVPVLLTSEPGTSLAKGIIAHRSGFVVPPGNPSALIERIRSLLDLPRSTLREMGERGRAWMMEECSIEGVATRYHELLLSLLPQRRSS
jgi:glycosyltransferase involved in cell wall biosynthesis